MSLGTRVGASLFDVIDPELGVNIMDFGLIYGIVLDHDDNVTLNYPPLIDLTVMIEVGDSWEQSVLDYSGIQYGQRFLLWTKLFPQSLRFLMDLS